jgi:type VI secretion system protein ImpL
MKQIMMFFKNAWVIELIGILIVSVLIWFVGPLIAIAGVAPLESVAGRIILIAVILVFWLLYRFLKYRLSANRDQQLVAGLTGNADENNVRAATDHELDTLNKGFVEALALLKSARKKTGSGKQFLYELPWYAIIGAPGSGKTTALIHSGLHFPLSERLGKHTVKGVSGTRDCDWWLSDEAILLDTAGRYTTQDSHQEIDASAWNGFLGLLKKYRPQRPLNGVFLAVSISDLLQFSEEESLRHASTLRKRMMELNTRLGVKLPVYVLLTKTDLIAGFTDFFANFSEAERNQVWGETFTALLPIADAEQPLQQFAVSFDELVQKLTQLRLKRLLDEREVTRRAAIFDFPQQMILVKPALMGFLEAVFAVNRFEESFFLRGVYFTSGTQEGTPIDRILTSLVASFRLDRLVQPLMSGRGKSYFLQHLLKQVVFPEAELVGSDPRLQRRYKLLTLGAYIAAFSVLALGVTLWMISYGVNQSALATVEQQIQVYQSSTVSTTDSRSGFLTILPKLNALQAGKETFLNTGWSGGFGLYQGDKINAGIDMAYEHWLRESFLPLIQQRLKERMQGSEGNHAEVLYQLLRVYLMLAEPERMDAQVAQLWIQQDWDNGLINDPKAQADLQKHLANLLALKLDPLAPDQNFVASVRTKLTQIPLVNQVYSRFKSEALFNHDHDVNLAAELAPNGNKVFMAANGKDLDSMVVPGLFSSYGYAELFLKNGMDYVKDANAQNWVLGVDTRNNQEELERLYGDFKRLYLAEYQKNWDGVLTGIKFRPQPTNNQLVDTLDLLSRNNSPLKLLLELIEKQTALSRLSAEFTNPLAKSADAAAALPDAAQKLLALARLNNTGADPVKTLEAYFEPYNTQVRTGADKTAPIDSTLVTIKNLHDYLLQVGSAPNNISSEAAKFAAGGINPIQAAKVDFARLPGPIASSLSALTNTGGEQIKTGAKGQLNEILKTSVSIPCKEVLSNRYPFSANAAQDVLMADFAKVFAGNGLMDQFFNNNLKAFVDTTSPNWREMASEKSLGLSADSIRQFQIAAKIRDEFFPAGNQAQVVFELKPLDLDGRIGTFRLSIDGQELVYRHGPEQLTKFQWPGVNGNPGVMVVFETLDGKQYSRSKEGAWALFRMLSEFNLQHGASPDRFNLTVQLEGYTAHFELRANSVNNPFRLSDYLSFHCPESL